MNKINFDISEWDYLSIYYAVLKDVDLNNNKEFYYSYFKNIFDWIDSYTKYNIKHLS